MEISFAVRREKDISGKVGRKKVLTKASMETCEKTYKSTCETYESEGEEGESHVQR